MTTAHIATAISTLISLAGIWILMFWFYRDYRTDHFRQSMFALRDELFDLAADGKIAFDHPAYGLLRTVMNGFIRFGHRFTLAGAILMIATNEPASAAPANAFSERWRRAVRDVDPETLSILKSFENRMNLLVIRHAVLSSPILVASIILPIVGLAIVKFCVTAVLRVLRAPLDGIDTIALAEGAA